jgi:hypothetical protein
MIGGGSGSKSQKNYKTKMRKHKVDGEEQNGFNQYKPKHNDKAMYRMMKTEKEEYVDE